MIGENLVKRGEQLNKAQGFVIFHLREVLVEALAEIDGNDFLCRYLRARSRLRLIPMNEEELQELVNLFAQYTNSPAETVYQEIKAKTVELKRTSTEWLKDLLKFPFPELKKGRLGRVLIIENEPSLRKELVSVLSQAGFVVSAVSDYSQALQRLYEFKVDLIIMESLLEDSDGFNTCRDFRNTFGIPVILLGSFADDAVWERVMQSDADHYEVKPYRYQALIARAKAILRRCNLAQASRDNNFGFGRQSRTR
jgi:PleD family two-component response regulator